MDKRTVRDLAPAVRVLARGNWRDAADRVVLGYDERFLRRRRLVTAGGAGFMVDLSDTVNLAGGEAFGLADGTCIEVVAAREAVMVVRGDLPRLAWHIGNRHTPAQIEPDRLLIRADPVLEGMLTGLGARVTKAMEPFSPETGAYGMGRTMGHHHGDGAPGTDPWGTDA